MKRKTALFLAIVIALVSVLFAAYSARFLVILLRKNGNRMLTDIDKVIHFI